MADEIGPYFGRLGEGMNVLHLSTYDRVGGAASACLRLHRALSRSGVTSEMLVRHAVAEGDGVEVFWAPRGALARLRRLGRKWVRLAAEKQIAAARQPDEFSVDVADYGPEIFSGRVPDLIHLHWVHRFLDPSLVLREAVRRGVPAVWTLHDSRPLTGGCHFPGGCDRFMNQCGRCPELGSVMEGDATRRSWERVHRAVRAARPYLVAPSRWMADQIRASSDFSGCAIRVIPYGLDTDEFRPRESPACRTVLGLPPGRTIVLFIADRPDHPRKGGDLLMRALDAIPLERRPLLLTCGRRAPEIPSGIESVHVGHETNPRWLSVVYGASDYVVVPSREDNLPQTALEAMACGRPVVGFRIGGMPDMVIEGETGWLAAPGDAGALAGVMEALGAEPDAVVRMGQRARASAEQNYSLAATARSHRELYQELIKG